MSLTAFIIVAGVIAALILLDRLLGAWIVNRSSLNRENKERLNVILREQERKAILDRKETERKELNARLDALPPTSLYDDERSYLEEKLKSLSE